MFPTSTFRPPYFSPIGIRACNHPRHASQLSSAQLSSAQNTALAPPTSRNINESVIYDINSWWFSAVKRRQANKMYWITSRPLLYGDHNLQWQWQWCSSDGMDEKRTNPATFAVEEHNLHFETAVMNDCRMTCSEHWGYINKTAAGGMSSELSSDLLVV